MVREKLLRPGQESKMVACRGRAWEVVAWKAERREQVEWAPPLEKRWRRRSGVVGVPEGLVAVQEARMVETAGARLRRCVATGR